MGVDMEIGAPTPIWRDGMVVGAVAATPGEERRVRDALRGCGLDAPGLDDAGGAAESERIRLDRECTADDREPCELATALGVAAEVAAEMGLPSDGTLQGIVAAGVVSVPEARAVLAQWAAEVRSAPAADEDALGWAEVVESEVLTPEPGPTEG